MERSISLPKWPAGKEEQLLFVEINNNNSKYQLCVYVSGTDSWDLEVNKTKLGSHGTAYKRSARHMKRCWVELRYYEEK